MVASVLVLGAPLASAQQARAINTATITAPAGVIDPDTGNNTATDDDPIVAPLLAITKTHVGDFTVGVNGTYTITVANTGTAPTTGTVTVLDTLPAGLTHVSASGSGWTCTSADPQQVSCSASAVLAAGASAPPITVTVAVAAAAMPAVTNAARASGGGDLTCPAAPAAAAAHCLVEDPTNVLGTPELTLVKTASAAAFEAGVAASYTLAVTNSGDVATSAVAVITDTVPAGLAIGALPAGCALDPAGSQTVQCSIPAGLAVGASASFTIPVVPASVVAGSDVTNSAQVSGGGDDSCPAEARCSSTVVTPVGGVADFTVAKAASVADSNGNTVLGDAGDVITYTFSVSNTGTVDLTNVVVSDEMLPGLVCTIASLPVGATNVACVPSNNTYVITAADVTAGKVTNIATATGTPPGTIDPPTPTSPPVETPTAETPVADFSVAKAASVADTNGNTVLGDAGDVITYTFSVSNTGTVDLTNVVVSDAMLPGLVCTIASLPVGATNVACVPSNNTYVITAADVTAGKVTNIATATGTPPGTIDPPTPTSPPVDTPTAPTPVADFSVAKAASVADTNGNTVLGDAGDVITYTFSVSNTGTVDLTNVVVSDAMLPGMVCTIASLPVGATNVACTPSNNTYVITAADVTAGQVTNIATATGTPPGTIDPPTPTSPPVDTPTAPTPVADFSVAKAASVADTNGNTVLGDAGDVITYTFSVSNTGTVDLTNVVVSDAMLPGLVCTIASLPVGATNVACVPSNNTYVITAADVTAGKVTNIATATGTPPGTIDPPTPTSPPVDTPTAEALPALSLVKTAGTPTDVNGNGIADAGDTIAYSFAVSNDGNVPLNGVVINDTKLSATPIACTPSTIPVGGTAACGPVTYTITAADVANGSVDNSATASGTPPGGTEVTSDPSTTTTPTTAPAPALSLVKTAGMPTDVNGNGLTDAGDTIAYSFAVSNDGNVPLNGVVIADTKLSATPIACTPSTIAVGGTAACGPVTYTITPADVASGSVDNSATASGTPPGGTEVTSDPSTTTTPTTAPAPALSLVKTAGTPTDVNGNGITDAGDTIDYSFAVSNDGNVPLNGVVINDTKLSATPIACTPSTIAVGGTAACGPVTYTITAADVANGSVDNSATASGTPPGGTEVTSDPSTTTTPTTAPVPALGLVKTAGTPSDVNGNGITDAGDTIAYSFAVTNDGNVPLNGVVINDAKLSATPIACTPSTIAVGGSASCGPVTYTITAADVANGSVDNSATASGTPPGGTEVTSDPSTTTTPTTAPVPALGLVKTAGTPSDVNGNGITDAGDTIAYSFAVSNDGNVPLNGVVINDTKLSATPIACTPSTIPVGGTAACGPVTYTITPADVANGSVDNSATASGTPPGGTEVTSAPSTTTTPTTAPAPALSLVKTAGTPNDVNGNGITDAGDTIDYSFAVSNDGNVPVENVVINDAKLSATPIACAPATIAVGGSASCGPVTYTITAADEATGTVHNSATATGTPPGGTPVTSDPSTTDTPITVPAPALSLVKTAGTPTDVNGNGITDAGDTIDYSFAVSNDGNVPVENVVINDTKLSTTPIACTPSTIAVGGTAACGPVTYTITAADEAAGTVHNSATATGTPPGGTPVTSDPSTTDTPTTAPAPALSLVKTAGTPTDVNGNGLTDAGDTIAYSFAVSNDGNVPVENVVINDAKLSGTPIACTPSIIAVGGSANCGPVTYTITAADEAAGTVHNSATATGTPPGGTPVTSDPSTTDTPVTAAAPSLRSQKRMTGYQDADGDGQVSVGDTLTYAITVTNTGNVALLDLTIVDARLTPDAVTCGSVAPNATCELTGTYVVTQADADAGRIVNTALVTSRPPTGTTVLPPEACPVGSADARCAPTVTVPVTQRPAIATSKTATLTTDLGTQGVGNIGDVITYAVTATNTGNVTLFDVGVLDSFNGGPQVALDCAPTVLAPGETATCASYTHTVTVAEANAGGTLDNTVLASGRSGNGADPVTVTATGSANVPVEPDPTTIRVVKTASPRDVKTGDLVRYTLSIQNTGTAPLVDGSLVDTPPAGFNYVDGSLAVADDDGEGRLAGTYPIRVDQLDIAAGARATVTYLLRVGAGVRPGIHTNSAYVVDDGTPVSNVATADVQMVSDPALDDSLVLGTVFDDRDGDGWQDSAAMTGIRVQGGFAPGAYVPASTTVDRGNGPVAEPDASAPMLHGIALGELAGRQSDADPVAAHTVVVSQTLRSLDFSDDFVLTTKQGASVRMDAAGNTRVESSGDAAKGLTAAAPTVERRISQVDGGYRVDYVIANAGVDERGIPGVRIASVEGLLVETDQFGRYHLLGVEGGSWERGRNFILKVDPATLPPGSELTTDNPLVRRVTPGLPVRFDFGVKLPKGLVEGGEQAVEMELGRVLFDADSDTVRDAYLPVIGKMAEQVRAHGAGEVVIAANGDPQALAYDRARAVQSALLAMLTPQQAQALQVSLRTDLADPSSTLLSLGATPVLGTVLFDTDRADIKPEYMPLIAKLAAEISKLDGGVVGIVGHADRRGADAYNAALGLRRAKAVFDAIAAELDPGVRSRLRVEISDSPTAPVGIRGQ